MISLMDIHFTLRHSDGGHASTSKGKERGHPEESASLTTSGLPWIHCLLAGCERKSQDPSIIYRHIKYYKKDEAHKALTETDRMEMDVELKVTRPGRKGNLHLSAPEKKLAAKLAKGASDEKKELFLKARYLVY